MSATLLTALRDELERLVGPLVKAVDDIAAARRLLRAVGADESFATRPSLLNALAAAAELRTRVAAVVDAPDPSYVSVAAALKATGDLFSALRTIDASEADLARVGTDLIEVLTGEYLRTHHPLIYGVGGLVTLIDMKEDLSIPLKPGISRDGEIVRWPFPRTRLRFDRLHELVKDPGGTLRAAYFPNGLATVADANAGADRLFPRVGDILTQLDVIWTYGVPDDDLALLGDAAPLVDHAFQIYVPRVLTGSDVDAGITLTLSSDDRGGLGLVLSPFGALEFSKQVGRIRFDSLVGADIEALAIGAQGPTFLAGADTASVNASFKAAVIPETAGAPAFVLGSPSGTRLEVGSVRLGAAINASLDEATVTVFVDASSGALVIAAGDSDGFVGSLLPADGLRADFDLGLTWSSETGLTLRGSGNLEATVPVGLSVGGLSLTSVHLGLRAAEGKVETEISASLAAAIGPVRAVLDRVGIAGALTFPEGGGNLGVADLALGLKPPTGIGLTVDAQGVLSGGGFLFHDEAQHLYAGVLQLSLHETLTVTAFGLIATRLPDGSRGYSLIIFITAEDFRPIQLGMGFTLLGIGGMVAVHRTFDEAVLRAGLESDTLGALLFPREPVKNAPAIIRALASAFPARRGSYLLGLLVRIGWATPTLVQLDLALILEFGGRRRLLVLGRISALLPSRDNDLIRLNLNAMGVLDFDEGTATIDAVLVDSRLAHKFVLTGAMALRARWTAGPGSAFLLAVGGWHPRFTPPTGLPALARVAIALSAKENPRLTCEAYFAITSNTLQFGARAALYAAAYGFTVAGDVGFDVLMERAPLHFLAEFTASLQLKRGSRSLFKVKLAGALEGPRPLRVSGEATFEILWCDVSVRFDKTLVDGEGPPLPPAVDLLAALQTALGTAESWHTQPAPHQAHGVALRAVPGGPGLVIDPLGQLVVRQQVVPLNTGRDIDHIGGAPVTGARRFTLAASLGTHAPPATERVYALFAPAQFFVLSEDEQVAGPSFEEQEAGLVFGGAAAAFDPAPAARVAAPLAYTDYVLDDWHVAPTQAADYALTPDQLRAQSQTGAAARAKVRRVGRARFRDAQAPPPAEARIPRWAIVSLDATETAAVAPEVQTWSDHRAALATLNRGGTRWQLVPAEERHV